LHFFGKIFRIKYTPLFFDFWSGFFLKKKRFLLIALALSVLLHVLVFVFAPELKSEINSDSYLKKTTKISIFRDDVTPKRRDDSNSAPNRNIEISKSRNINRKHGAQNRNAVTTERRDDSNRDAVTTERRDDNKRDAVTTGRRDDNDRDDGTTGQRDDNDRDAGTPGRRDDETTGAPKTAGELAVIPKPMNPKTPDYPESLEDEGIEGTVTLELLISKEGKVLKAKVIKSDHELFSESALKAVKKYKFSPGKLADGSSADSLIEFVVKFEISL